MVVLRHPPRRRQLPGRGVYTKPFIEGVGNGLAPYVSVELDRPDGSHHQWEVKADATAFHAAIDRCDVTIGPNTFRDVLHA